MHFLKKKPFKHFKHLSISIIEMMNVIILHGNVLTVKQCVYVAATKIQMQM